MENENKLIKDYKFFDLKEKNEDTIDIAEFYKYYLDFEKHKKYELRIKEEITKLFNEKSKSKYSFYPSPNNRLIKSNIFNQLAQALVRRLWEEEDYFKFLRVPNEIPLLMDGEFPKQVRIRKEDIYKYAYDLKILPFIIPETMFFTLSETEHVLQSKNWYKKSGFSKFLEKIHILFLYMHTVFFSAKHLALLSANYLKAIEQPISQENSNTTGDETAKTPTTNPVELKADIFMKVLLSLPEVQKGYFTLTDTVMRRSLLQNDMSLLEKNTNIKRYIDMFTKYKLASPKITYELIVAVAEKFQKRFVFECYSEGAPPKQAPTPIQSSKIDYVYVVDMLLFELKNMIRFSKHGENVQTLIKNLSEKLNLDFPLIEEKHVTLTFLLMKEVSKNPNQSLDLLKKYFSKIQEFVKIPEKEVYLMYFLVLSDLDPSLTQISLSQFVEKSIEDDERGLLSPNQITILRQLFKNVPETVKANHFFHVKESLKARISDPSKKKQVDLLSSLVHQKIREIRSTFVIKKFKEKNKQ